MRRRRVAAMLIAVAALVGCSADRRPPDASSAPESSVAPTTPATTPTAAVFVPAPIDWTDCGTRVKCARLDVPLDYANPTGATISLALNERPARHPDERIGALLFNPGGPGGSGLQFVASGLALPSTVLDHFDLVGFDPRGVGQSTPLPCGDSTVPTFRHEDATPDTPDEQTALDTAAKAVADDCGAHAADLIAHVGTDDVVRDMDTIRQALGDATISYLGVSYGTLLGLRFAALFPHSIRAFVIDGVIDPTQDLRTYLRQQTIAFDGIANGILEAQGVTAKYDELANRVEASPMRASDGGVLGPTELATAALMPAYESTYTSPFVHGLDAALDGDASALLRVYDAYTPTSFINYVAVSCVDSPHPVGSDEYKAFAQELERLSPRFGGGLANELLPCAYWAAPVQSVVGPVAAPDAPPMLVVGTTGDSATPYQQAVSVAGTLTHGRLLTYDGVGHSAYGKSRCVESAEAAFFVDLTLPDEGATCSN